MGLEKEWGGDRGWLWGPGFGMSFKVDMAGF